VAIANALQPEAARAAVLFCFNCDAHDKFEVAQPRLWLNLSAAVYSSFTVDSLRYYVT